MLNSASPLKRSLIRSPLRQGSIIRPTQSRFRRNMFASLMLTSLVDAFSILVIFLIMNHSASQESLNVDMQKLSLPHATESQLILDGVTVRIDSSGYLIEQTQVQRPQLVNFLKNLYTKSAEAKRQGLIIVADKNLGYEELNPVILAGSQAGFSKFKFAVIRKEP